MFRFKKSILIAIFCFPFFAFSSGLPESWPTDLEKDLESALLRPSVYRGFHQRSFDYGRGVFCHKRAQYSLNWKAELGDFTAELTEEGTIKIHLEFDRSFIDISGSRIGGLLCIWNGGSGRINVDNLTVDFILSPSADNKSPDIDLRSIQIHGFTINQVTTNVPFFYIENGTAPDWLVAHIEKNFNYYIPKFLQSSLGARFDKALSKKIRDAIDKERDQHNLNQTIE